MDAEQIDILMRNIAFYGEDIQSAVAMEECAELIQAVSKITRYGLDEERKKHLIEEIADVSIIVQELVLTFGISAGELRSEINRKVKRLEERMDIDRERGGK